MKKNLYHEDTKKKGMNEFRVFEIQMNSQEAIALVIARDGVTKQSRNFIKSQS